MDWILHTHGRTAPADLKAALEKERDTWVATTPQESHDYSLQNDAIQEAHSAARATQVKLKAQTVLERCKTLDTVHTQVVKQMDAAIAAAVGLATFLGTEVRVTIAGHCRPDHDQGIDHRFNVSVDQAL